MVPAPLGFLEMFVELDEADAALFCQRRLGIAPERFNAVDMASTAGELVRGMMNAVVPEAVQNESITRLPAVGVNHRRTPHPAPDDAQKLNAGVVRHDLGEDLFPHVSAGR